MDGFKRFLGVQPDTRLAVLIFGLFHGFGLATKLQEFELSANGLVTKGEALLYSWKATGPVNVEFHAEPDGAPRGYAQSYEKTDRQPRPPAH